MKGTDHFKRTIQMYLEQRAEEDTLFAKKYRNPAKNICLLYTSVAGLAVAFATFIIIMIQISFERNFDRCHPTADRIYRVELSGEVVELSLIHICCTRC